MTTPPSPAPQQHQVILGPQSPAAPVTLITTSRSITVYSLTEDELDMAYFGYGSINQTFLGIAFGIVVTALVTLGSVALTDQQRLVYVVFLAAAVLVAIFFGWRCFIDRRNVQRVLDRLRRQTTQP